ncbi:MAG: dihydrolipoyl dehydrogenase [Lachnospiraceae bacterium]|nr:dihydrolipoyl dehydrogenase [Lachnospiraceae bacterium]
MSYQYDIVVIGAGPGGYETAIKAAQTGKKTCIIEKENCGGTCLNVGCIPTKTLIRTAALFAEIKEADKYAITGLDTSAMRVDMQALQKRKDKVVKQLVNGVKMLLKANGVERIEGTASFEDAHTLKVGDKQITAENIIIATGSKTFIPPFIAQEGQNTLLTSTEALALDTLPESIAIIGGGVIGVEFAYLFGALGVEVTVLELMDHILPMVDTEISEMARKRMAKQYGIRFVLGARVKTIRDNTVLYELDGKEEQAKAQMVLMAVGRTPNTDGLNAEGIGLEFDRKAIRTNEYLQTSLENIYAIGDVNGKVMLAHTASHEGMAAVANIGGAREAVHYDRIPSCIYLHPEISCIGLTEAQAKEKYENVKIGRFTMNANGKSLVEGDTDGCVKVILEGETGEILGVHIYGQHATEMIGEISVAVNNELTAEEIIASVHPHPTVNEAVGEAFMAAWYGKPINSL